MTKFRGLRHQATLTNRVGFSPREFAAAFGKSVTWTYRLIYQGKLRVVTDFGRMVVPASEVDRILSNAGVYNPAPPRNPRVSRKGNGSVSETLSNDVSQQDYTSRQGSL
jgi:hypothetical protein